MPRGDGTGPNGQGPGSGRRRGPCQKEMAITQGQGSGQGFLSRFGERLRQKMGRQDPGTGRNRRQR
jgi:hypothetical protein